MSTSKLNAEHIGQLNLFEPRFHTPSEVDAGGYGRIYRIDENLVAKVLYQCTDKYSDFYLRQDDYAVQSLSREFNVGNFLHQNKVRVAEPLGVFAIPMRLPGKKIDLYPGFVMEYLKGYPMNKLKLWHKSRAIQSAKEELRKVEGLGVQTDDNLNGTSGNLTNGIWVPKISATTLIDYDQWKLPEQEYSRRSA